MWAAVPLIVCSLHVRCTVLARQTQELGEAGGGRATRFLIERVRRMRLLGSNAGDWVPGGERCVGVWRGHTDDRDAEQVEHNPTEPGWVALFDKADGRSGRDWACLCREANPPVRVGSVGQRWRFAGRMYRLCWPLCSDWVQWDGGSGGHGQSQGDLYY